MSEIDLNRLAQLAHLALQPEEAEAAHADLKAIMGLIDRMQQFDVGNTQAMANPLDLSARLRADEVTETVDRATYQQLAPQAQDGLYLVPQVID